jgi:transketolase
MNLDEICKQTRNDILTMTTEAGSGHPGGSLSCVEILVALYYKVMQPEDVFILSKGHAAPALYSVLSQKGVIPRTELHTLRKLGGLQGHPVKGSGITVSTGSLGQGLSIACGIALARKLDKKEGTVYVLLGDGECQEGMVWEAAMYASHMKLDNLVAIVDYNGWQIDGKTTMIFNLRAKWKSFGWDTSETFRGNDIDYILSNFSFVETDGRPTVIIANTVKGAGVKKMEGKNEYHGKVLTHAELQRCLL